jgi:UDP-glucose 4-epimerase
MTRILITGAFGYVGGRVGRYLAEQGYQLRLGSRDATRQPPQWLGSGDIKATDFDSDACLEAACQGIDCIIHLANTNEAVSRTDPELALSVNGGGTIKLLRAASIAGVKRVIYLSTAHIYGAPLQGVISEETLPRPRHPYAITHRGAEEFVRAADGGDQPKCFVLRLSNSFGAPELGVDWALLVNDLCRQAVTQKKLVLRSAGLQRRDFLTLTDVGRAVRHVIELPQERCGDGLFNLGGENPMRILDVAESVAGRCEALLGFRPEVQRPEPASGEKSPPLDYRIDKLKATGFRLHSNIIEEIDATLKYCHRSFGVGC